MIDYLIWYDQNNVVIPEISSWYPWVVFYINKKIAVKSNIYKLLQQAISEINQYRILYFY